DQFRCIWRLEQDFKVITQAAIVAATWCCRYSEESCLGISRHDLSIGARADMMGLVDDDQIGRWHVDRPTADTPTVQCRNTSDLHALPWAMRKSGHYDAGVNALCGQLAAGLVHQLVSMRKHQHAATILYCFAGDRSEDNGLACAGRRHQ